jgi:membrane associated rhomboid family serine protease
MTFLDKLERRIGFIAIPGLIRAVVALTALVFLLVLLNPGFEKFLALSPKRIMHGEVWRLVTYLFLPQTLSPLWLVLALWFLWFIGEGLERAWGPFRLTLYFVIGMVGTTIAAFIARDTTFSNSMLVAALFFAFATFYPDEIIYILFILPVKVKWLAWVSAGFMFYGFVVGTNSYRLALVAALSNYLLFFGPRFIYQARHRQEVASRRKRFELQTRSDEEPLHRCAVCGKTELNDPNLEFRVSRNGEEYCMEHLPRAANAA